MKRIAFALATVAALSSTSYANTCNLTMDSYKALQSDMTLTQANAAVGCTGKEQMLVSAGKVEMVNIMWDGSTTGNFRMLLATFKNGKLYVKTQTGLK
jgi:hypothetical protein